MIRRIDASISSIVGSPRESAITLPLPAQILFSGRANRPRRLRLRGLARPPIGNAVSHPTVVGVGIIDTPAFQPQVPRISLAVRRDPIERATCRESECQYEQIPVVAA